MKIWTAQGIDKLHDTLPLNCDFKPRGIGE